MKGSLQSVHWALSLMVFIPERTWWTPLTSCLSRKTSIFLRKLVSGEVEPELPSGKCDWEGEQREGGV